MSSISTPRVLTFKATAAIARGNFVKVGASNQYVTKAAAASDKIIGIAMNDASVLDDKVEVALIGGGARALAGGTIAAGDFLTSNASGAAITTTTNADRYGAQALEDAIAGDLLAVEVVCGII